MFGSTSSGANAYRKVSVETGVVSASPHKLIAMLFDGALISVNSAISQMKAGNISGKGQAISKAILIIDGGLRASLDKKVGGDIANNLDALYQYMSARLLMANIKNEPEILEEVRRLLKDLKDSWEAIGDSINIQATQPAMVPPQTPIHDPLEPHASRLVKA